MVEKSIVMTEKKTVVSQLTIDELGNVLVQLSFLRIEDGVETQRRFHRTMIPKEVPPELQMAAVNMHLTQMGEVNVSPEEIEFIKQLHRLRLTSLPQREHFYLPGEKM